MKIETLPMDRYGSKQVECEWCADHEKIFEQRLGV